MSRNHKFHNPKGLYFISFAVVEWLDVFTRREYKDIVVDSLNYCIKEKGIEILAWCIMTNHVHLVFRAVAKLEPQQILGDFKRHTSKKIVKAIQENQQESRRNYLLSIFRKSDDKTSNVARFQFWRHDNKPIELWSNKVIKEKIQYIHYNPATAGIVFRAEDYMYSSAIEKGLANQILIADIQ